MNKIEVAEVLVRIAKQLYAKNEWWTVKYADGGQLKQMAIHAIPKIAQGFKGIQDKEDKGMFHFPNQTDAKKFQIKIEDMHVHDSSIRNHVIMTKTHPEVIKFNNLDE